MSSSSWRDGTASRCRPGELSPRTTRIALRWRPRHAPEGSPALHRRYNTARQAAAERSPGAAVFSRHRYGMTLASTLLQTTEQAAQQAGLTILATTEGSDFHGKPTSIFRLGLAPDSPAERTLALELSNGFAPVSDEQK